MSEEDRKLLNLNQITSQQNSDNLSFNQSEFTIGQMNDYQNDNTLLVSSQASKDSVINQSQFFNIQHSYLQNDNTKLLRSKDQDLNQQLKVNVQKNEIHQNSKDSQEKEKVQKLFKQTFISNNFFNVDQGKNIQISKVNQGGHNLSIESKDDKIVQNKSSVQINSVNSKELIYGGGSIIHSKTEGKPIPIEQEKELIRMLQMQKSQIHDISTEKYTMQFQIIEQKYKFQRFTSKQLDTLSKIANSNSFRDNNDVSRVLDKAQNTLNFIQLCYPRQFQFLIKIAKKDLDIPSIFRRTSQLQINKYNLPSQNNHFILKLSYQQFDIHHFVSLAWSNLIQLNLQDCHINSKTWKILSENILKFNFLCSLNLRNNYIKQIQLEEIQKFEFLNHFQCLDLIENQLTKRSLELIEEIRVKNKMEEKFSIYLRLQHVKNYSMFNNYQMIIAFGTLINLVIFVEKKINLLKKYYSIQKDFNMKMFIKEFMIFLRIFVDQDKKGKSQILNKVSQKNQLLKQFFCYIIYENFEQSVINSDQQQQNSRFYSDNVQNDISQNLQVSKQDKILTNQLFLKSLQSFVKSQTPSNKLMKKDNLQVQKSLLKQNPKKSLKFNNGEKILKFLLQISIQSIRLLFNENLNLTQFNLYQFQSTLQENFETLTFDSNLTD